VRWASDRYNATVSPTEKTQQWLLRAIDRWLPPSLDPADDTALLKARLVVGFAAAVALYVPFFGLLCLLVLDAPLTGVVILTLGSGMIVPPLVQRAFGASVAGHTLAGSLWATVSGVVAVNGGPDSGVLLALAIVPVFATSLCGRWPGAAWAAVAAATVATFHGLAAASVGFPTDITWGLGMFQAAVGVAVSTLLFSLTALFDTAQQASREAVAEREDQIRRLIDAAPDGMLVIDERGGVLRSNRAATDLLGADPMEVSAPHLQHLVDGLPADAERGTFEVRLHHPTDGSRPAELSMAPLPTEHGRFRVAVMRDIRLRKEAERAIAAARDRALEASRAKSAFLANMSHELRTPLNAVIGYGEMVHEELDDLGASELAPDVEHILTAARHLLQLIDDILDLSKIESGRLVLAHGQVVLPEVLSDLAATVEPLVRAHDNTLATDLAPDLPTMTIDATRLRQVLLNLLSNAAKFTRGGQVTLRAMPHEVREGVPGVRFEVVDTGVGMTEVKLASVFEQFVQADSSTTRTQGGSGLGLTICWRLVHLMGGRLTARSAVGEGSRFCVDLPQQPPPREPTPAPGKLRHRVLVIDEDGWSRERARMALTAVGLGVELAQDGPEGLAKAHHLSPDLVLLAGEQLEMAATTVLQQLKSRRSTRHLRVIWLGEPPSEGLADLEAIIQHPLDADRILRMVRTPPPRLTPQAPS